MDIGLIGMWSRRVVVIEILLRLSTLINVLRLRHVGSNSASSLLRSLLFSHHVFLQSILGLLAPSVARQMGQRVSEALLRLFGVRMFPCSFGVTTGAVS